MVRRPRHPRARSRLPAGARPQGLHGRERRALVSRDAGLTSSSANRPVISPTIRRRSAAVPAENAGGRRRPSRLYSHQECRDLSDRGRGEAVALSWEEARRLERWRNPTPAGISPLVPAGGGWRWRWSASCTWMTGRWPTPACRTAGCWWAASKATRSCGSTTHRPSPAITCAAGRTGCPIPPGWCWATGSSAWPLPKSASTAPRAARSTPWARSPRAGASRPSGSNPGAEGWFYFLMPYGEASSPESGTFAFETQAGSQVFIDDVVASVESAAARLRVESAVFVVLNRHPHEVFGRGETDIRPSDVHAHRPRQGRSFEC